MWVENNIHALWTQFLLRFVQMRCPLWVLAHNIRAQGTQWQIEHSFPPKMFSQPTVSLFFSLWFIKLKHQSHFLFQTCQIFWIHKDFMSNYYFPQIHCSPPLKNNILRLSDAQYIYFDWSLAKLLFDIVKTQEIWMYTEYVWARRKQKKQQIYANISIFLKRSPQR